MNIATLRIRIAGAVVAAATFAAAASGSLGLPGLAHASTNDGPWPEPPSCSNETGTCTSIEDRLAYECWFEQDYESPFSFCDDPFALQAGEASRKLAAPTSTPDPARPKLVAPAARR